MITDFPQRGVRVLVTRLRGDKIIARRDIKPDAIFRDPTSEQWLNDDDKFVDIQMNPVVVWEPIPDALR